MSASFILASKSPRRRNLLEMMGFKFNSEVSGINEIIQEGESPTSFALRLSKEKALAVLNRTERFLPVLAADTIVFIGDHILNKPKDKNDAIRILEILSGKEHEVATGLTLCTKEDCFHQLVITRVCFRKLSKNEIAWYVATGEPMDKAGAYGFQGIGNFLISNIKGSPSNVIGLPLAETFLLLKELGIYMPWHDFET